MNGWKVENGDQMVTPEITGQCHDSAYREEVGAHRTAGAHALVWRHLSQWTGRWARIVSDSIHSIATADEAVVVERFGLA